MTPLFSQHTFSTDWELMVLDRLTRMVDMGQIKAFAGALTDELDLPIHTDWGTIEFGLGINSSFEQFRDRLHRLTRRASEMLGEHDIDLFPCGSHPVEKTFNAAHIHVGTLHDESAAIRLEAELTLHAPAFAALAANSPFHAMLRDAYKSYRVHHNASGASRPWSPRESATSQPTWGHDASHKLYKCPTLEVRVIDSASSPAFLAELSVFVAAFVHQMAEQSCRQTLEDVDYKDYLTNRWLASRDGLQATFSWRGRPRPVAEMLGEMLDFCAPSLARLGAKRRDLAIIGLMLKKRFGQADFAISVMDRYPDPYALACAYGNLIRHWNAFEEFLVKAPRLDPLPHPSHDGVLLEHLRHIGQSTHYFQLWPVMNYPPAASEAIIESLLADGKIEREITTNRGTLLHRRK